VNNASVIDVLTSAARQAGQGLVRDFAEIEKLPVTTKGQGNYVSEADHGSEKTLFRELSEAYPGYGFLMEEGGAVQNSDTSHRWIVDPLDGTTNFLRGIPHFCIAIALERDHEVVAAVVYNPIVDELFTAEIGKGAHLNGRRINVTLRRALSECVITTFIPHGKRPDQARFLRQSEILMGRVGGFRATGSSALDLAWVAAGRFDGHVDRGLQPWDMAAGALLVREAGGITTDIGGGQKMFETASIIAGNNDIHGALLLALN
jgi:myo-inositol-1(or 4)-monophosphatase